VVDTAAALVSIGDFASSLGLSTKTLRRYSDAGLIRPTEVDSATGYRWYDVASLDDARLVVLLRRLDMPIATVRRIVELDVEQRWAEVAAFWSARRQRLADESRLLERVRQHMFRHGESRLIGSSSSTRSAIELDQR
jgi:DNA-binding transcriptional MerR regulator